MGASVFRRKLKDSGINNITVENYRIEEVPDEADIVIVHEDLLNRSQKHILVNKLLL